jgi:hypothetical protein
MAVRLRGADGAITTATDVPTVADVTTDGRIEVPRSTSRKEGDKFLANRGSASEMGEDERSHHRSSFGWPRETNGRARGDKGVGGSDVVGRGAAVAKGVAAAGGMVAVGLCHTRF